MNSLDQSGTVCALTASYRRTDQKINHIWRERRNGSASPELRPHFSPVHHLFSFLTDKCYFLSSKSLWSRLLLKPLRVARVSDCLPFLHSLPLLPSQYSFERNGSNGQSSLVVKEPRRPSSNLKFRR